jgi:WD40 repeat protein
LLPDSAGRALAIDELGRVVLLTEDDSQIAVWDVDLQTEAGKLSGVALISTIVMTQDRSRAAVGYYDHTIKIWDLTSLHSSVGAPSHTAAVDSVAVTDNGQWGVSWAGEERRIWNLTTGEMTSDADIDKKVMSEIRAQSKAIIPALARLNVLIKRYDPVQFEGLIDPAGGPKTVNPDGKLGISAVAENAKTSEAEESEDFPASPRGYGGDYSLRLWDLEHRAAPHFLAGHSSPIMAVQISSDGRRAISASLGRVLRVWNVERREQEHVLRGHRGPVWATSITPDGHVAVSASEDSTLRVWHTRRAELAAVFTGDSPMTACAITSDAARIIAGDKSGQVHILRLYYRGGDPAPSTEDESSS